MSQYLGYRDDLIKIEIPDDTNLVSASRPPQSNTINYIFSRRKKPKQTQILEDVIIYVDLSNITSNTFRRIAENFRPLPDDPCHTKLLRRGPTNLKTKGEEIVVVGKHEIHGWPDFSWSVLFMEQHRWHHIEIRSQTGFVENEGKWRHVIQSFQRLKPLGVPSQPKQSVHVSTGSHIWRIRSREMGVKDKDHLRKALESLPSELLYLREPIWAIADGDQDMLGTGEFDSTALAEAVNEHAVLQSPDFAAAQADQLERWLKAIPSSDQPWAAPAWSVIGFLIGYDMFSNEQETED